jgi:poly-beta-1,6-N-acetyl-D-glucosamine biosynthesis protein PgaD
MKWPPLIDSSHLPRWVVARDAITTLLAWCVLLYYLQDMALMAVYWVLRPFGVELPTPWAPGEILRDTVPFLKVVVLLVLWLMMFAIVRWRLITDRAGAASRPEPLDPQRQADAFGLSDDALDSLRDASSATIHNIDPITGRAGASIVVRTGSASPGSGRRPE